jgi:hypothetical protein
MYFEEPHFVKGMKLLQNKILWILEQWYTVICYLLQSFTYINYFIQGWDTEPNGYIKRTSFFVYSKSNTKIYGYSIF